MSPCVCCWMVCRSVRQERGRELDLFVVNSFGSLSQVQPRHKRVVQGAHSACHAPMPRKALGTGLTIVCGPFSWGP